MKTARQSHWYLTTSEDVSDRFITLSNDQGDYLEVFVLPPGFAVLRPFDTGIGIWDLPRSVLDLCEIWLDTQIPFEILPVD